MFDIMRTWLTNYCHHSPVTFMTVMKQGCCLDFIYHIIMVGDTVYPLLVSKSSRLTSFLGGKEGWGLLLMHLATSFPCGQSWLKWSATSNIEYRSQLRSKGLQKDQYGRSHFFASPHLSLRSVRTPSCGFEFDDGYITPCCTRKTLPSDSLTIKRERI